MLNNLEVLETVTKESMEALNRVRASINTILSLGLLADNETQAEQWKNIQKLTQEENEWLIQISHIQNYLMTVHEALNNVKPTYSSKKERKKMISKFLQSMNKQEYDFASHDEDVIEEVEIETQSNGLMDKIKGIFKSETRLEIPTYLGKLPIENVVEPVEIDTKPIEATTKKKS